MLVVAVSLQAFAKPLLKVLVLLMLVRAFMAAPLELKNVLGPGFADQSAILLAVRGTPMMCFLLPPGRHSYLMLVSYRPLARMRFSFSF